MSNILSAQDARIQANQAKLEKKRTISAQFESIMGNIKESMKDGKLITTLSYEIADATKTDLEELGYKVIFEPESFNAGQITKPKTYIRWD